MVNSFVTMEVNNFDLIEDPFKTRDKIPRSPIQIKKKVSFNKGLTSRTRPKSRPPSILIPKNKISVSPKSPLSSQRPSRALVSKASNLENIPLCRIPSVLIEFNKKKIRKEQSPPRVPSPFQTKDKIPRERPSEPELNFPSAHIVQLTESMENPESDYSSTNSERSKSIETLNHDNFESYEEMHNSPSKSKMTGLPLEPPSPFLPASPGIRNYHNHEVISTYQFMPRKNRFNSYQSEDSIGLPLRPPSPFYPDIDFDSPITVDFQSPRSIQPELSLPSKFEINNRASVLVAPQPVFLKSPASLTSLTEKDLNRFSRPSLPSLKASYNVDQDELISMDQVRTPRTLSIQFKKEMISFANFEQSSQTYSSNVETQTPSSKHEERRLTPLEPILIRTTPRSSPRPTPPKISLEQDDMGDITFNPVTTVPSRIIMNPTQGTNCGSPTKIMRSKSQKVVNGEKVSIEQARVTYLSDEQLEEHLQKRSLCGLSCNIM